MKTIKFKEHIFKLNKIGKYEYYHCINKYTHNCLAFLNMESDKPLQKNHSKSCIKKHKKESTLDVSFENKNETMEIETENRLNISVNTMLIDEVCQKNKTFLSKDSFSDKNSK
jgi:hypothetical protein